MKLELFDLIDAYLNDGWTPYQKTTWQVDGAFKKEDKFIAIHAHEICFFQHDDSWSQFIGSFDLKEKQERFPNGTNAPKNTYAAYLPSKYLGTNET